MLPRKRTFDEIDLGCGVGLTAAGFLSTDGALDLETHNIVTAPETRTINMHPSTINHFRRLF